MLRWFGRNSTNIGASAITEVSALDDGNDSDVSLLITNEDNEVTVTNVAILPRVEGDGQSTQQMIVLPRADLNRQQAEVAVSDSAEISHGRGDQGRRRRRHHHRHHHRSSSNRRRDRPNRLKTHESNFFSAIFNLIVVVLTGVAMFEPRWLHIQGGQCTDGKIPINYLGIKTFFALGRGNPDMFHYGSQQVLLHCVTSEVITVMRVIIALCLFVVISSMTACIMDVVRSARLVLRVLRSTASLPILSVCTCIVITGLCYLLTQQLTNFYVAHRLHESSRVVVEFDIGFYMITAAGAVSVIAVGSTLMHVHSPSSSAVRGWSHDSVLEPTHQRRDPQLLDRDACLLTQATDACLPAARAPPPYRP